MMYKGATIEYCPNRELWKGINSYQQRFPYVATFKNKKYFFGTLEAAKKELDRIIKTQKEIDKKWKEHIKSLTKKK